MLRGVVEPGKRRVAWNVLSWRCYPVESAGSDGLVWRYAVLELCERHAEDARDAKLYPEELWWTEKRLGPEDLAVFAQEQMPCALGPMTDEAA